MTETDTAQEFLTGVLSRMKIGAEVEASENDDQIMLDIQCTEEQDVQRIIGRRGQVVDALQHLVGKVVSRSREGSGKPIVVDAAGYRHKHIERLEGLATRMAEKCLGQASPVDLNPMNPHDRRIINMTIAKIDGVSTESAGEGEDRHVVVHPE